MFGLPRALSGGPGEGEEAARAFAAQLQQGLSGASLPIEIKWWDERFSTREALGQMRDAGISQKRGRDANDGRSTDARAAVILQGFLDSRKLATDGLTPRHNTAFRMGKQNRIRKRHRIPSSAARTTAGHHSDALNDLFHKSNERSCRGMVRRGMVRRARALGHGTPCPYIQGEIRFMQEV